MSDIITTAALLSESEAERKRTLAVLDLTAAQRDKFIAGYRRLHAGIEALADEWDLDSANAEARAIEAGPNSLTQRPVNCRHARLTYQHASALRDLLEAARA